MQNCLFAINHYRMASIMTALKPDDSCRTFCQQVNDFALALIAPLATDNYNVSTHFNLLPYSSSSGIRDSIIPISDKLFRYYWLYNLNFSQVFTRPLNQGFPIYSLLSTVTCQDTVPDHSAVVWHHLTVRVTRK